MNQAANKDIGEEIVDRAYLRMFGEHFTEGKLHKLSERQTFMLYMAILEEDCLADKEWCDARGIDPEEIREQMKKVI